MSPVASIIDGDTIILDDGQRVRYLGIDTPEAGEPFYLEAKSLNITLLAGRAIRLESDVTNLDIYGRLLRYVYADNIFVNAELVKKGFALIYAKDTFADSRYFNVLKEAVDEAASKKLGIWSLNNQHPKLVKSASDYYYVPAITKNNK
jgi:micrococcal nuclease